jgi:hypothetical protein
MIRMQALSQPCVITELLIGQPHGRSAARQHHIFFSSAVSVHDISSQIMATKMFLKPISSVSCGLYRAAPKIYCAVLCCAVLC